MGPSDLLVLALVSLWSATQSTAEASAPLGPASAEWQGSVNTSSNGIESSPEFEGQIFQLSVDYGHGALSLEANGDAALSKAPSSAYEDGLPVSGTYREGSVQQLRTVASALIPFRGRALVLGLGLENLDMGVSGRQMNKSGGTLGSFQMNSLIFEVGALKSNSRWGEALVTLSYDLALGGKLRSRYEARTTNGSDAPTYAVIEDKIAAGGRLSIGGSYQMNLMPGLAFGIFTMAQFGTISFVNRTERSYIYGYTYGLSLRLKI